MTLPPGPTAHPLQQLLQWLQDPLGYLEQATSEFGDLFTVRWGPQVAVLVHEPQALQTILTHPACTAPGDTNRFARPLVGDRSLLLLSGKHHQQRRRLLMPPLHGEHLLSYSQSICTITRQILSQWGPDQTFLVHDAMQELTLQVILRVVFGLDEGDRLQDLKQRLVARLEMTAKGLGPFLILLPVLQQDWGPWSPWGQVMQRHRACDELIYAQIQERRHRFDPERVDILNLLLSARDEEDQGLSDVELRDELVTLLFTGHETTSAVFTWALYWIHAHPEVKHRLLQEISSVDPETDPMAVTQLPYLTAVCQEVLRISPVTLLTLTRRVQRPLEVSGYTLEPGTEAMGAIYLTHNRPDLYSDPKRFNPQRFLDRSFSGFEFIPFGGGPRRCVGDALALFEMKLVLTLILQQAQLELVSDQPLKPVRRRVMMAPEPGFSMRRRVPSPVQVSTT